MTGLLNWTFLVGAPVLLLEPMRLARWNLVMLGAGFGALAIIAWEGIEWIVQQMGTAGPQRTYDDNIDDLVFSTSGGVVAAPLQGPPSGVLGPATPETPSALLDQPPEKLNWCYESWRRVRSWHLKGPIATHTG